MLWSYVIYSPSLSRLTRRRRRRRCRRHHYDCTLKWITTMLLWNPKSSKALSAHHFYNIFWDHLGNLFKNNSGKRSNDSAFKQAQEKKKTVGECLVVIMMGVILRLGTRLKVVARERSKKEKVGWNERKKKNLGVREERKSRLIASPFLNRHVIKILYRLSHTAVGNTKGLKGRRRLGWNTVAAVTPFSWRDRCDRDPASVTAPGPLIPPPSQ